MCPFEQAPMHGVIDLNAGSGFVYGRAAPIDQTATQLNDLIDAALVSADRTKPPRDYLGASRIGVPCSRRNSRLSVAMTFSLPRRRPPPPCARFAHGVRHLLR